jgi:hypothetical protein
MWKEAIVVKLKILSMNLYGGSERTMTRRIFGVDRESIKVPLEYEPEAYGWS